ncbi:MAG: ATPase [Gammaproteobacteria bacterium RIFCSPHIGHO2_12_FULL_41_15]|nr:MAG: ATPase [Gammaproteobacteria bacterium RIFCSPHIGHO2_12_FULL_41_15]
MHQDSRVHNAHWESPEAFSILDPQLRKLAKDPYQYASPMLSELPIDIPGIYIIGGGRQVGKSTLLKLWMKKLLDKGINPKCILYLTGELIDDHHQLVKLISQHLAEMPDAHMHYILLDEITYVTSWDKGVKYLSDAGLLDSTELVLTGSDLVIMQQARMTFPGRRGIADLADFHLYPISFYEWVKLQGSLSGVDEMIEKGEPSHQQCQQLMDLFYQYLAHGGYLAAINDIAKYDKILPATLRTYAEWVKGDVLKRHKQEHYLEEIIKALLTRYGSQLTWNALAQALSIEHPQTVADYIELLQSMDAVFIQHALLEDKLVAAPKKAKKILFTDPFIYHAIQFWITKTENPYQEQIIKSIEDPEIVSLLVETTVVNHFRRYYPTYFIKAAGEVDIAYIKDDQFWPIEIKWTTQFRSKDLKQIVKYQNAEIWGKTLSEKQVEGVPIYCLPWMLLQLRARG